jgi:hypothetical protein
VVEGFASVLGGTDEDLEVLHHLLLTGETVEPRGAQRAFYLFLLCGYIISCQIVIHDAKIALFFLTAKSFSKTTTTNLIFNTKHIFGKKAGKEAKSSIYKIVTISIYHLSTLYYLLTNPYPSPTYLPRWWAMAGRRQGEGRGEGPVGEGRGEGPVGEGTGGAWRRVGDRKKTKKTPAI